VRVPQVGTAVAGNAFGLGLAPGSDSRVMTGQQDIGHAQSLPLGWARVVRIFQQVIREGFFRRAVGGAHHTGKQSHGGIQ
jgi:hypothetical protein